MTCRSATGCYPMNRILLVNDRDAIMDRTAAMLEGLGWEVYVAHTEGLVFESCVAFRPGMLIADVEMSGGIGFEAISTARRLFRDLFIVAVTRGGHDELWPKVASVCGANRYVIGPVSTQKLEEAIETAVTEGLLLTN